MRIGFDQQIFLLQKRGGVSRYFVELIKQYLTNPTLGIEPVFNFQSTSNELLLALSSEFHLEIKLDKRAKPIAIATQGVNVWAGKNKFDLMHHTFLLKNLLGS